MFLEDGNDLFFGKSLALHVGPSQGSNYREIPHRIWTDLWGKGHCA
jgi:hypothetical protein